MNTEQLTNSIPPELMAWLTETFSSFAAIAVVVFLAFVLWGAFQGWRRSIFRQVIHVVVTVIIAIISFSVTSNLCTGILAEFQAMSVADIVLAIEAEGVTVPEALVTILEQYDMGTIGYVFAIFFNTLVAPLLFAVLFAIIAILGKVVTAVVCFFVPKGKTLTFRILGIAGGVIEGALIAGVVLLPLVGWVNVSGRVVETAKEENVDNATLTEVVDFYDEIVAPLEKHVIFQTVGSLGGNDALTKLAVVEVDGATKDVREEFESFTKIGLSIVKLSDADFKQISAHHKTALDAVIDSTTGSTLIKDIILSATNGLGVALGGSDEAATLPIVFSDADYAEIINELATILANTDEEDLNHNLHTIANLYYLLSDEGIIAMFTDSENGSDVKVDEDALSDALMRVDENGKTVINRAIEIIDENENMRGLVTMLGHLSVKLLYESLGIEGDAVEAYDKVSTGVKDVLSIETEGKEVEEIQVEVSERLTTTLESVNITVGDGEGQIPEDALEVMSGYVAEELKNGNLSIGEDGEVTDADVLNVLLSYYQSLTGSEEIPEGLPVE